MPTISSSSTSLASRRARSVHRFVIFLRWITALYAVATLVAAVALTILAPDCIAIGVSILKGKDCTNRETYHLILAASAGISIGFSLLLVASAYAIDLLGVLAFGPLDGPDEST